MGRSFIFASALEPEAVARAVAASPQPPDLNAVAPLVVVDGPDILGATAFGLDEAAVIRLADHLNRALPLP